MPVYLEKYGIIERKLKITRKFINWKIEKPVLLITYIFQLNTQQTRKHGGLVNRLAKRIYNQMKT